MVKNGILNLHFICLKIYKFWIVKLNNYFVKSSMKVTDELFYKKDN